MWAAFVILLLAPETGVAEAETKARQALTAGEVDEARGHYEAAIRAAESTAEKLRLRDLYLKAGWAEPRPANQKEQLRIETHIRNEKIRLYGKAADRFEGADKLHAAIIMRRVLLEMAGGPTTDPGKQAERKIRATFRKLVENPTQEQKDEAAALVTSKKKNGKLILKAARKLLAERRFRLVVRVCQELQFGAFGQDIKNAALALRKETEDIAAAEISAAQRKAALDVLTDERFERIDVRRSRHFLFVGPQKSTPPDPHRCRPSLRAPDRPA